MFKSRRAGGMLAGMGMFFLFLVVLLFILHEVGTDAQLYYRLQMRADILPEAGITSEELWSLDEDLAAYLAGEASALDAAPFNEKERIHMADCYDLFVLLRRAIVMSGILALALTGCGLLLHGCLYRAAMDGTLGFIAVIAALGLWGMIDFDSLFTLFHKMLFANDLWLLDPRTDLLIRICPQSMFSTMALIIGTAEIIFILIVNLFLRALPAAFGRHK
jgi:integral membrane protein (TIGR01906 family)